MAFKCSTAEALYLLILGCVCGIVFFANLGSIPFYDKGEPREALVVRDIVLNGNWIFPLKLGEQIPSKPPLFHWVGCLGFFVLGSNDGSNGSFSIGTLCQPWSISRVLSREEAL